MSATCPVCRDSGESGQYGMLDCQAPACAAATDRAALEAHLQAHQKEFGRLHERDMVWEAYKLGQAKAQAVSVAPIPPFAGPASQHEVSGVVLPDGWRARIREMRDASYTITQYPEIADVVFDSVLNALDELESEQSSTAGAAKGGITKPPGTRNCDHCDGKGVVYQCVICGSSEPKTGTCGSDDPRALCNFAAPTNNSTESTNEKAGN